LEAVDEKELFSTTQRQKKKAGANRRGHENRELTKGHENVSYGVLPPRVGRKGKHVSTREKPRIEKSNSPRENRAALRVKSLE